MGYFVNSCPAANEDVQLLKMGYNKEQEEEEAEEQEEEEERYLFLVQNNPKYNHIPSTWFLLDSCSTASVFKEKKQLTNIRESDRKFTAVTNGGPQRANKITNTKHFGEVWFNAKLMVNILSLVGVCKFCRINMDSKVKAAMYVYCQGVLVMDFK